MLAVVLLYLTVGCVFGVYFVLRAVNRLDPAAAQSGWGFRLAIFPGSVALWPVLLYKMRMPR